MKVKSKWFVKIATVKWKLFNVFFIVPSATLLQVHQILCPGGQGRMVKYG